MVAVWAIEPALDLAGVNPGVLHEVRPYMTVRNWWPAPRLIFFALRRDLQSIDGVRPIMIPLIAANLVNIAGTWIFVFGDLGAPALGAVGSGWATFASRMFMFLSLAVVV